MTGGSASSQLWERKLGIQLRALALLLLWSAISGYGLPFTPDPVTGVSREGPLALWGIWKGPTVALRSVDLESGSPAAGLEQILSRSGVCVLVALSGQQPPAEVSPLGCVWVCSLQQLSEHECFIGSKLAL